MADVSKDNKESVERDENGSSKKNDRSHSQSKQIGSFVGEFDMFSEIDAEELDMKMEAAKAARRRRLHLVRVAKQMNARTPSIQELLDANRMIYMQETFDEIILNYKNLSYEGIYKHYYIGRPDEDSDEDYDEERLQICELFGSDRNFWLYETSVKYLIKGNMMDAKRILLDLVNDAVEPACYAYALVFFKETLRQCDVFNDTEENFNVIENHHDFIWTAVHLLKIAGLMEPACGFLLGMLKRFNIGGCSQFINESWQNELSHVVDVGRTRGFLDMEHYILEYINPVTRWNGRDCGLGMQKKQHYVKQMALYSLYELTVSMSSERFYNANAIKDLFELLSENEFPQALYSYGAMLLVGKTLNENIESALLYLNRAILAGHEGAELLLGSLIFNNKVSPMLTRHETMRCTRILEGYIDRSKGPCVMNEETINKAAYCLASHYMVEGSCIVLHDKQKAKEILDKRNMHKELRDLLLQSQIKLGY